MGGRTDSHNDPLFPTHTVDFQTGQDIEGRYAVFREGKWWGRKNWEARRKSLYAMREKRRRYREIHAFFGSQSADPGL